MTLFSTGEVSKKLNISLRTLRYYDQIGLVVPTIKKDNGKRYYSEEDMLLLEKITKDNIDVSKRYKENHPFHYD